MTFPRLGVAVLVCCLGAMQDLPGGLEALNVTGDFVDPVSGLHFPERVGEWRRTNVLKYPPPPVQHSASYEFPDAATGEKAVATGYVYAAQPPVPETFDENFESTVETIVGIRPGAELVSRQTLEVEGRSRKYEARLASMVFHRGWSDSPAPALSQLLLLKPGNYWVRWRLTFPAAFKDNTVSEKFIALVETVLPR